MTRKTKTAVRTTAPKQKVRMQQPPKKSKPFSEAGSIVGNAVGSIFGNAKMGKGIGRFLGSGIGSIFGSGDYTLMGAQPKYNVLVNSTQIPKFDSTKQTNIVCHREYLGDINGTAGFNNSMYPLNPGIATTFPWLATIAQNYQEYVFHGVVFEFRPLITDFITGGAPGVVVMATNYNADAPVYTTKQEMENSEYAVSVKPTNALMHGIECAINQTILPQRYVRSGSVPLGQDLRLYDYGNFQFATQANPVQDLGELWVSYCVEFHKPILPVDVGGDVSSAHVLRTSATTAVPFGTVTFINSGDLTLSFTAATFSFFAQPAQQYIITLSWNSATSTLGTITPTFTGMVARQYYVADANLNAQAASGTSGQFVFTCIVFTTILNPGLVTFNTNGSGPVITGLSTVDVIVSEFSNFVTA
jgi:hypothetical protein